jgi:hypothetical protein
MLITQNPRRVMHAHCSFCAQLGVHFNDVFGIAVLLTEMPAGTVTAYGEESEFAATAVESGDGGVEGGDVACVAGVEDEGMGWGCRRWTVDDEETVPEGGVCVEGVSC